MIQMLTERVWRWLAAGLLLLALASYAQAGYAQAGYTQATERSTQTTGEAYDMDSGELLYRETHCVSSDESEREVFYSDGDGKLLARKLVDYRSGATTPSFEQQNFYSSELIRVALREDELTMVIVDADSLEARSEVSLQTGNDLPVVIDAGFDAFVRQHWDSLVAGEQHQFQFPFADRESLVELRIGRLGCSYDSNSDQCFRLDLANWFLRMLVAPIELGYDSDNRRLMRYRGLSNIGDVNGNGLVVDLRYDYPDAPQNTCQAIQQSQRDSADSAHGGLLASIN
jgi:hypothetical protein